MATARHAAHPRQAELDEIEACRHWLSLELALVRPRVLVCLGATAAQTLLGRSARVTQLRGRVLDDTHLGLPVIATLTPPPFCGRVTPGCDRRDFVSDLELVRATIAAG